MKQLKSNTKSPILIPKQAFTKSQERLIKKLETLKVNREVAGQLVRASHPKAIKNWVALMKKNEIENALKS